MTQKKQVLCDLRVLFGVFNCQTPEYISAEKEKIDFLWKVCRNYGILLSLTVSRLNNRCIPCIFWATAIVVVVTKYSNLFFPFTFFLNGSHAAFGYELIIRSETTDFMERIRDKLPPV